jgi:hypothetical protein
MRRWCVLLLCLTLSGALAFLAGCQGEDGIQGEKGSTGPAGPGGYDPTSLAPTDRYVSIGITNASFNAVAGAKDVYVSFDSTVKSSKDTIVANHVTQPPLIDGVDGDIAEWGEALSKVRLSFYSPQPDTTVEDPNIFEVLCRAAWDDENVYMLLSWKEVTITVKTPDGRDSTLVLATPSYEMGELRLNVPRPDTVVDTLPSGEIKIDTTFAYLRTLQRLDSIKVICFPPPPAPPVFCDTEEYYGVDTTLVWRQVGIAEDRAAVIWNQDDSQSLADDAFDLLFRTDGFQPSLPADAFMDVWLWGASTTLPVETADDYVITSTGLEADAGSPPYSGNFLVPDSVPRYQNKRDPNIRTSATIGAEIYPLWYYDLKGYKQEGWALNREAFAPGIVTMIPSGSRADVYARATFDNGVWVVEMKRSRKTNSGDDMVF